MVGQRRALLDYLKRKDLARYKSLIETLVCAANAARARARRRSRLRPRVRIRRLRARTRVTGTLSVGGEALSPLTCRPGRAAHAFVEVVSPKGILRFEDRALFWTADVNAVGAAPSSRGGKLDRSWGGGSRPDGSSYWRGILVFECTLGPTVVRGDLDLDCGNITAEERQQLDGQRENMRRRAAQGARLGLLIRSATSGPGERADRREEATDRGDAHRLATDRAVPHQVEHVEPELVEQEVREAADRRETRNRVQLVGEPRIIGSANAAITKATPVRSSCQASNSENPGTRGRKQPTRPRRPNRAKPRFMEGPDGSLGQGVARARRKPATTRKPFDFWANSRVGFHRGCAISPRSQLETSRSVACVREIALVDRSVERLASIPSWGEPLD